MVSLVGRLRKAGVPILVGTDGYGLERVRELELGRQAGRSNAAALQTAMIVPGARHSLIRQDGRGQSAAARSADAPDCWPWTRIAILGYGRANLIFGAEGHRAARELVSNTVLSRALASPSTPASLP